MCVSNSKIEIIYMAVDLINIGCASHTLSLLATFVSPAVTKTLSAVNKFSAYYIWANFQFNIYNLTDHACALIDRERCNNSACPFLYISLANGTINSACVQRAHIHAI